MKWFLKAWMDLSAFFDLLLIGGTNWYMMSMVVIAILKAAHDSLSMKWNTGLIPWIFNSPVNSVRACVISLSLLFFIAVVMMPLK